MVHLGDGAFSKVYVFICNFLRKLLWAILAVGPMPNHVAVIMDGNRRFARTQKLEKEYGHRFGFLSLISTLRNCYELGVKYVTVYAFSIDNFKRKPDEVGVLMELLHEKLEDALKEESFIKTSDIKVLFVGNLSLLPEQVQHSAQKLMEETAHNTRATLSVCVCYTSTDEIAHAVEEACENRTVCTVRCNGSGTDKQNTDELSVTLADLEKHMYMVHCPDPDILIRTSGETRLSNFLLWQSCFCYLHITKALWPEFSLRHLVWAILEYQRVQPYLEKMTKKLRVVSCIQFSCLCTAEQYDEYHHQQYLENSFHKVLSVLELAF